MTARTRRIARFLLVIALTPIASACGRDDTQVETRPGTEVATDAVRVTDVRLGTGTGADGRVTNETTTFRTSDMIYAVVNTDGVASGTTMTARWTYQDGQVVDETSQTISPTGPSTTEFHIMKPDGFPAGSYQLEILLNGRSVERRDFTVN